MSLKPRIIVVVGPTASGKSDCAVRIAQKFNGEIISADSRQVYRGLNIGTGKITQKEMRGIPHHLIDIASPKKQYSVAVYQQEANKAIQKIITKGKLPIICGGTGFYVDALVYNSILPDVTPNKLLRKQLEGKTTAELYKIILKIDPRRAMTIDSHNPRRLVRAIEIASVLGSVPEKNFDTQYDPLFIGLDIGVESLSERIHTRLERRMDEGMCEEVTNLHNGGLSWKRMEEMGLEYRYVSRYVRGIISEETMITKLASEIIDYAKRQRTWFKRNKKIVWIPPDKQKEIEHVVKNFLHAHE